MSRLTIEETIKERIRYDELNNDINLIPKWLEKTTIPHYDEYKKCFLDGVNCKRYTDLKIVTDVLHDLEEQGRLIELPCKVGEEVWTVHKHWGIQHATYYEANRILLDVENGHVFVKTKEEAQAKWKEFRSEKLAELKGTEE